MLTKVTAKFIKSLHTKKNRNEHGLFLVEGAKSVLELLTSDFKIDSLYVTKDFFTENKEVLEKIHLPYSIVVQDELERISTLESNDSALAVVFQKQNTELRAEPDEITLLLDDVRDPGNLGTIIRIADWYGIKKIIASNATTDRYNSKTIVASMGSFTRIEMYYTELEDFLSKNKTDVLGTFLEGQSVYTMKFPKGGILVMGNESNGIRSELLEYITKKITIPSFGNAESLNVAVATAVLLDNWKRSI